MCDIDNPFAKHVASGWQFTYEYGFVGAEHPKGGKFSVCELKCSRIHGDNETVGKAIAAFFNSPPAASE